MVLTSAFRSRIVSYRVSSNNHHINLKEFTDELRGKVLALIQKEIQNFSTIKVNFEVFGHYFLESQRIEDIKSFQTPNKIVTTASILTDLFDDCMMVIDGRMSEFQERDSGT